jgi:hypothetical protein
MRTRSYSYNDEGMGWGMRVGLGIAVLLVVGAVGLSIYAGRVTPARHSVEQVLPDDKFPH